MPSISSNSRSNASANVGSGGNRLSDSLSAKLCPSDRKSDFSWSPITSPSMLSASASMPIVGAKLRTLAASTSLALAARLLLSPKKLRGLEAPEDAGESSRESVLYVCVSVYDSCVVALEARAGRIGLNEWDVDGRDPSKSTFFGRGGKGGGVPSLDNAVRLL